MTQPRRRIISGQQNKFARGCVNSMEGTCQRSTRSLLNWTRTIIGNSQKPSVRYRTVAGAAATSAIICLGRRRPTFSGATAAKHWPTPSVSQHVIVVEFSTVDCEDGPQDVRSRRLERRDMSVSEEKVGAATEPVADVIRSTGVHFKCCRGKRQVGRLHPGDRRIADLNHECRPDGAVAEIHRPRRSTLSPGCFFSDDGDVAGVCGFGRFIVGADKCIGSLLCKTHICRAVPGLGKIVGRQKVGQLSRFDTGFRGTTGEISRFPIRGRTASN